MVRSDHDAEGDDVYPPIIAPVVEVFLKALLLSEKAGAREIGVDHLLAALDNPTTERKSVEQSTGPYVPIPYQDPVFSNEAQAAIEGACALVPCDLEQLTIDWLRTALVAARRDRTK
jgi:hypothetical protein